MSPIQLVREALDFFYQIYLNRHLVMTLTRRDFEKKYIKNFFGMIWAIFDPFAFVTILYFVFGARYGKMDAMGVPFITYLLIGYISYDLFNISLQNLSKSVFDHAFILKKVSFRVAILPVVRMMSNLMIHGIILLFGMVVVLLYHVNPSWYWFQIFYYIFAISVFLIASAWFTSSVYLFFPDIENIIGIITRVMFFLTPIFWNIKGLDAKTGFILKLNPMYYITTGYRDSLLYHQGFWTHPTLTIYFWILCLTILVIGVLVFKKLRPHFADVVA
jgi:ABC-type polysaccharide/polyol phosphate export permease